MSTQASTPLAGARDWRVRYRIEEDTRTVVVFDISHRSDIYGA